MRVFIKSEDTASKLSKVPMILGLSESNIGIRYIRLQYGVLDKREPL